MSLTRDTLAELPAPFKRKLLTLIFAVRQDGARLLGMKKRGFGAGRYNGFGGKVEPGEEIDVGAVRELHEESLLLTEPQHLRRVGRLFFEFQDDTTILDVHIFDTRIWQGEAAETEEMRPQWFNEEDVPFDMMWPDDRYWFPLMRQGKYFTGYFYFKDQSTFSHHKLVEGRAEFADLR
ncbi:uncharacterized protein MONBRDRAFT_14719 [Monosiga brevicollis MX1]|uniref:Oxidized purine nucleoside triphosphate hydrolase n=1 Tax=Monosiga brevicollis TaxID=81824 RepID=A9US48_MONBE|nr:uncharacterized protein MONBRDRAFT_14719 [Monosiga brevicollis MX1]EDQ92039.1 predicted protein [Monosiga brevicollis MX1]|eukprot:XP_001743325.1 hypothetical protein [Monosiga brevicollis MX1]